MTAAGVVAVAAAAFLAGTAVSAVGAAARRTAAEVRAYRLGREDGWDDCDAWRRRQTVERVRLVPPSGADLN